MCLETVSLTRNCSLHDPVSVTNLVSFGVIESYIFENDYSFQKNNN